MRAAPRAESSGPGRHGMPMRNGRQFLFAVLIFIGTAGASASAATPPWDVDSVYLDDAVWQAERRTVAERIAQIEAARRRAPRDVRALNQLLDLVSDARGRAGRMAKVGLLQALVDEGSEPARQRREQGAQLEVDVERAVSFVEPMVRGIGEPKLRRWLAADGLSPRSRRRVNRILRLAAYAPPQGSEQFAPDLERGVAAGSDSYDALLDASLGWPDAPGKPGTRLDPRGFEALRRNEDAAVRRAVNQAYFEHVGRFRDLFAFALTRRIEASLAVARLHRLEDPVDGLLVLKDGMPQRSCAALFKSIAGARPVIQRAARILARVQRVERPRLEDLAVRRPSGLTFTLEKSQELILRGAAPI